MDEGNGGRETGSFFANRLNIAFVGFLVIGGFFLVSEHRAHLTPLLSYLPFALLLACPLLHLFMHHGHGSHHGTSEDSDGGTSGSGQKAPSHQH